MVTILIVEDDLMLQKALVDKFTREGFKVLKASDGKEGLESILKNHPDVVLLDLMMPEMDGLQMLEKVRQDEWGKNVPVIVLSAVKDNDKIDMAKQLGARMFMTKTDWEMEGIVGMVNTILSGKYIDY